MSASEKAFIPGDTLTECMMVVARHNPALDVGMSRATRHQRATLHGYHVFVTAQRGEWVGVVLKGSENRWEATYHITELRPVSS